MTSTEASTTAPTHTTESISDRKKQRELAEARQSGAVAPEVDVKTGSMINPHNPEFITKRPWYLGGGDGPSLDHQADQRTDSERMELSLGSADRIVREERERRNKARGEKRLSVGMWVEALRKNKKPYLICQIVKISQRGTVFDLRYEDGIIERGVKMGREERSRRNARIKITRAGARSFAVDHEVYGKETWDSKRDSYHGYDVSQAHTKRIQERFAVRDAVRKKMRAANEKMSKQDDTNNNDNDNSDSDDDSDDPKRKSNKSKKHTKTNNNNNNNGTDSDSDYDSDAGSDSDDEFVQRDEDAKVHVSRLARQGGVGGQQMKVTARNLRIREDTAKYLRNLDPNSAYYDPKSRSMRDNPNPEMDPSELQFAGDNFARISGDAVGLAQTQVFAWDASEKVGVSSDGGKDGGTTAASGGAVQIHPQANPSQAELLRKKFQTKSADLKNEKKRAVLDKYGGGEYLDGTDGLGGATVPTGLSSTITNAATVDPDGAAAAAAAAEERKARFNANMKEERYTRDGRLAKPNGAGAGTSSQTAKVYMNQKSKYEEDIFRNGHTTVWGSYFHKGAFRWGYADDHSLLQNSYCTGANGRIANDEANEMRYGTGEAGSAAKAQAREMLKALPRGNAAGTSAAHVPKSSKLYGEADQHVDLDQDKVRAALLMQAKQEMEDGEAARNKRKYNSMKGDNDVTEEEMEAYRLRKERTDDPMAKLAASGELLEYK